MCASNTAPSSLWHAPFHIVTVNCLAIIDQVVRFIITCPHHCSMPTPSSSSPPPSSSLIWASACVPSSSSFINMNPPLVPPDNCLHNSRRIKLVPNATIAINIVRQTTSRTTSTIASPSSLSSSSTSPSSLSSSGTSDQNECIKVNKYSNGTRRPLTCCEHCGVEFRASQPQPQQQQQQVVHSLPLLDRQSFSPISNNTENRECICQQQTQQQRQPSYTINCVDLFDEFVRENMLNTCHLTSSKANHKLSKLELVGSIYPSTLLVCGHHETIKLLCSLWSRRLLKAPHGYSVRFIGKCIHIRWP